MCLAFDEMPSCGSVVSHSLLRAMLVASGVQYLFHSRTDKEVQVVKSSVGQRQKRGIIQERLLHELEGLAKRLQTIEGFWDNYWMGDYDRSWHPRMEFKINKHLGLLAPEKYCPKSKRQVRLPLRKLLLVKRWIKIDIEFFVEIWSEWVQRCEAGGQAEEDTAKGMLRHLKRIQKKL
jgi:hypothetical protein